MLRLIERLREDKGYIMFNGKSFSSPILERYLIHQMAMSFDDIGPTHET